jgi:hypothetical protein
VRDFSHRTVNPLIEYKQIIISQLSHGELSTPFEVQRAKKMVANLWDLKSIFADSLRIVKGLLK